MVPIGAHPLPADLEVGGLPVGPIWLGPGLVPAPVVREARGVYAAVGGYRERGGLVDANRDEGHVHVTA